MTALRKTVSAVSASPSSRPSAKPVKTMSIGVVLDQLRAEFPDITVSKIRFLESEGLVSPQRTASGYRRFTAADVERLRYILVTQRDNYLPLKVIREQLDAMDAGTVTAIVKTAEAEPLISPDNFRAPAPTRLTAADVAEQAGCAEDFVAQLLAADLIRLDASGFLSADDVRIVHTASALGEFGFDIRHLKSLRTTAHRQAGLIEQVAAPIARSQGDSAKQRAVELSQQLTALVVSLHASLVKSALRDELS